MPLVNQPSHRSALSSRFRPLSGAIWALAAVAALAVSSPAHGQSLCGDRERIASSLESQFAEKPVSFGLTESGGVFEVFVSPAGSWTILVTVPGGKSCYLASGEGWENLPKALQGSKI